MLLFSRRICTTTIDLLIKKLNSTISVTTDIILVTKERIDLRSYINISEDKDSGIITAIDENSELLKTILKFSEIDSDISIHRYSII
jgi:hypothetical protein